MHYALIAGLLHPITGIDHILAMLGVGLWGAQKGGKSVWQLPVAFPLVMVLGGILALAGVYIPATEIGIAASVLVIGFAIAFRWLPSEATMLFPVAVFAIFHGWAHGAELPNEVSPALYAAGFVIATGLIHVAGIGIGLNVPKLATRMIGCGIAAAGIALLLMGVA